ncbi:tetratricopeptide repeat protein [Desulfococcaceae bacterium HSG9]|nr:tetratricopeptide repeat protein [Desulfococcaceae bacterium HSG9]
MTVEISTNFFYGVRYGVLISLFLIITTLGTYYQVRNYAYVNFDDDDYVLNNIHIKNGPIYERIVWCFTAAYATNWHPLTWLSHLCDIELYGLNSGRHHLTNVLFHVINTLLLFVFLHKTTGTLWRSGFVAALFALHPLHVESVAWVSERKDVLSAFFFFLTLIGYQRYSRFPGIGTYLLVLLLLMLGLMSKPMLVTTPFVLLLLDYWPLRRISLSMATIYDTRVRYKAIRIVVEKLPLFIPVTASIVITYLAQKSGGAVASDEIYSLTVRIANGLVSYINYIQKMFWPAKLAIFYPHPGMPPWWQILGCGTLLVVISFLTIICRKCYPFIVVGWFWYLGMLVPVIGFIQVGSQAMADRYTYLPLIGLFISIAWGVPELLKNWRHKQKWLLALTITCLSVLVFITFNQIRYWKNSVSLFQHALEVTDNNFLAHHNLGVALAERGYYTEALKHYGETIRLSPSYVTAHHNMGIVLAKQGRTDEAIRKYFDVLDFEPNHKEVYFSLGNVMIAKGKFDMAETYFNKAIQLNPDNAETYNNLGVVLFRLGKTQEAIAAFQKTININHEHVGARDNLTKIINSLNSKKSE